MSMKRYTRLPAFAVVPLLCGLLASGCSMAPKYQRPDAPVPEQVQSPFNTAVSSGEIASAESIMPGWRAFFPDPDLQKLIALSLENNRNLRVAALNIERARAMYAIQRATQIPSVSANGAGASQQIPADLSQRGVGMISRQYSANLGLASFELDFFGRLQSLKDEALEQYFSTEEARRSAHISLVAQVASAYLTLAADREHLRIATETLGSQQTTYDMIRRRFELGVSSELELRQAQTSVDSARVDIARYTGQAAQDVSALALLVGAPLSPNLVPIQNITGLVDGKGLPAGVRSEILLRRPDILQAEHTLKGTNAHIGAARANFFPRIQLTANAGTASDSLSGLFMGGTGAWTFAPQISLPLFTGGANLATLRVSEADKEIAVARYEQTIQSAFKEVADGLVLRDTLENQLEAQRSLYGAANASYTLSMARFDRGVDSYLVVLDSQRYLYSAQQALVTVRLARENNLLMLYKALGGGWEEEMSTESLPQ